MTERQMAEEYLKVVRQRIVTLEQDLGRLRKHEQECCRALAPPQNGDTEHVNRIAEVSQ